MAPATVIHFGVDDSHRVKALRDVGYEVRESDSLDRLLLDIQHDKEIDAVIVSGAEPRRAEKAAVVVRHFSAAPLILFRPTDAALDERPFDRVYPGSAPPAHWLFDTAVVVMQNKELRAQSDHLRRESRAARA